MTSKLFDIVAGIGLAFTSIAAQAQSANTPQPSVLSGTESFALPSKNVGDTFQIHIGLPASYHEGGGPYPVIYRVDADFGFPSTLSYLRALGSDMIEPGFPEVILVGIGYPNPAEAFVKRQRDLTPEGTVPDDAVAMYRDGNEALGIKGLPGLASYRGGADKFLAFITGELDPLIRERYRADDGRAALMGASYGGLFSYYAFLKRSPLFNKFWIGSVGLITPESRYLIDELGPVLRAGDFDDMRVFMSVGEKEFGQPVFYGEVGLSHEAILRTLNANRTEGLRFKSWIIPGATHATSSEGEMAALRFFYHPAYQD